MLSQKYTLDQVGDALIPLESWHPYGFGGLL